MVTERFGIQGGDTGAFIAPEMGRQSPERVIGIHVNALVTIPSGDPADMAALTERERGRLAHHKAYREKPAWATLKSKARGRKRSRTG